MKPPFAYYGGKQRMVSKLIPFIAPHMIYCEPFCGGASLFFAKGLPKNLVNSNHYREVLNDTNGFVTNFFRVMQYADLRKQLIEKLEWTIYSEHEHIEAKRLCALPGIEPDADPDVLLAWALYINANWSFSKELNAGFAFSKKSQNNAHTHRSAVERLKQYKDRFRLCYIMNRDALEVIDMFDSPATFFYFDPPYVGSDQGHYKGFTQAHFDNLIQKIGGIQGSAVISCYDNHAIPSHWQRFEFESSLSAKGITKKESGDRLSYERKELVLIKPYGSDMNEKDLAISIQNLEGLGINYVA